MTFRALIVFAAIAVSVAVQAQSSKRAPLAVRQWRNAHETEILQQFTRLLSIPNVASDRENIQRDADLLKPVNTNLQIDDLVITDSSADSPQQVRLQGKGSSAATAAMRR